MRPRTAPPWLRWAVLVLATVFLVTVTTLLAVAVNVATTDDLPSVLAAIAANPWLAVAILTALAAGATLAGSLLAGSASKTATSYRPRRYARHEVDDLRREVLADIARYVSGAARSAAMQNIRLPCRLSRRAGAVSARWRPQAVEPPPGDEPLADDIVTVAEECGYSLLVLGDRGCGKTTELLRLLTALRRKAELDVRSPVPVLLDLSRWAGDPQQDFRAWVVGEIGIRFGLPSQLTDEWIDGKRFVFMFDGLHELGARARLACVAEINNFRDQTYKPSVVVCCRTDEYETLDTKLAVDDAVVIQPLPPRDVEATLGSLAGQAGLVAALRDGELRRLLSSPLMVMVAMDAFRGRSEADILGSPGVRRPPQLLLDAYVRSAVRTPPCPKTDFAERHEDLLHRLHVLADGLRRLNETKFYPERLQSTLLRRGFERSCTRALISALSGVLVASVAVLGVRALVEFGRSLPFGLDPGADFGNTVSTNLGLTFGLAVAVRVYLGHQGPLERLEWTWRTLMVHLRAILIGAVMAGTLIGTAGVLVNGSDNGGLLTGAINGLLCGSVCLIAFGLVAGADTPATLRATDTWHGLREILRTARNGALVYGLAGALVGGLAFGPASLMFAGIPLSPSGFFLTTRATGVLRPIAIVVASAITSVVVIGLIAALATRGGGREAAQSYERLCRMAVVGSFFGIVGVISSGWAAQQSDRSLVALSVGDSGGWLDAIAFGAVGGNVSALLGGLAVGSAAGLSGWLLFGGAVWLEQRAVRLALTRQGQLPVDLRDFLSHAEHHALLVPVRGGYAFRDETFRDYFADRMPRLDPPHGNGD